MRILYLCPDLGIPVLGRKGASVHVRALVAAFARAGHSVLLVAPLLKGSPWEEPATLEAPVLHFPPGAETTAAVLSLKAFNETVGITNTVPGQVRRVLYNQALASKLKRRFASDPPDLIYERASLYGTAGAWLACQLSRPLLVELNAPLSVEQAAYRATGLGELAAGGERWTLSRADGVLVISAVLRDYVVSLGVEPSRVHVLPNGVDPALFRPGPRDPEVRARWRLGEAAVLGLVGGLRPWHDVDILPHLLERLARRERNLRLVVAGDGPRRGALERALEDRGLAGNAVFTGALAHEDVAALIRQFDVALAPYGRLEHPFYFSPLKLFEYMACGTPVVAAGVGQIAEVVRDGETGLLYRPGDLGDLTSACERLLADPSLRRRLGAAAAQEIRSRYTWEHNAARVVDLARSLATAQPAGGR